MNATYACPCTAGCVDCQTQTTSSTMFPTTSIVGERLTFERLQVVQETRRPENRHERRRRIAQAKRRC